MKMKRLRFYMAAGALMATIVAGQASALQTDVFVDASDPASDEVVVHHVFDADPLSRNGFIKGRIVSVKDSLVCIRPERKGNALPCEYVVDIAQGQLQSDRMPEAGDAIEIFGKVVDVLVI